LVHVETLKPDWAKPERLPDWSVKRPDRSVPPAGHPRGDTREDRGNRRP
jgi:hypothetical protein